MKISILENIRDAAVNNNLFLNIFFLIYKKLDAVGQERFLNKTD